MSTAREMLIEFTRLNGPIAMTSRDVDSLLENDAQIDTFRYTTTQPTGRFDSLLDDLHKLLTEDYRKAAFVITCNRNLQPPLTMEELVPLVDIINAEPSTRDIFWAYFYDDSLPADTLCLNIVIVR